MAEPPAFVRIDTGYNPPGKDDQSIEIHGRGCEGHISLTATEADILAEQLAAAAGAIRLLTRTGAPCPLCGKAGSPGERCPTPHCPRLSKEEAP